MGGPGGGGPGGAAAAGSGIRTEVAGSALRVTIDRPARRNSLDAEAFAGLEAAVAGAPARDGVRSVTVAGTGPAFCAGIDLGLLGSLGALPADEQLAAGRRLQEVFATVERCPLPTLAVVQGPCIGAGVALALACDLRVAGADATFSVREMRYAFLPDLGHVHRLQREIGPARVKEMLFTGDPVDAATLLRWGVLNEVVEPGELEAAAGRWESRLGLAAPLAVAELKCLLLDHPGGVAGEASEAQALRVNVERLLGSADAVEGILSMSERRPPRFGGH